MPLLLLLALCLQDEIKIHSGPYKPAPPSLSVRTYLVELTATVKDRHNHPIPNLHAADFELTDNGKPQTITFFSEQKTSPTPDQATPPRSIVLFFDDTHTENFTLQKSRDTAKKFLSESLRPADHPALFTTDRAPLLAALYQLKSHPVSGYNPGDVPSLTGVLPTGKGLDAGALSITPSSGAPSSIPSIPSISSIPNTLFLSPETSPSPHPAEPTSPPSTSRL
jgi:hypothetical protein